MGVIAAKRKCIVCEAWMMPGEKFAFVHRTWRGKENRLPAHVLCAMPTDVQNTFMDVKTRAATTGHIDRTLHFEGEKTQMTENSVLEELKTLIARTKAGKWTTVDLTWLESLVHKYDVQVAGDTTEQPGEWQIRGGNVDAIQHDGTIAGASKIRGWINERGGNSLYLPTENPETEFLHIRLDSPRQPNIVGPGWWVVKTADGIFYTLPDSDFHIVYIPREK